MTNLSQFLNRSTKTSIHTVLEIPHPFTKDFFFLNFCNFPKTSSIMYFLFYFLEWETQALVLVNYWSFWNMKGFFIFGQFLVILIGLSVYAPLYRVRRNPEKRFLIPGVQTITKSNEIGAIERITYKISHPRY